MLFIVLKKSANLILDMLLISVMLIKKNTCIQQIYIYIYYTDIGLSFASSNIIKARLNNFDRYPIFRVEYLFYRPPKS